MSLQVYTARQGDRGIDALDVTRLSGTTGLIFAPSWSLLRPFLQKRALDRLTEEDWECYRVLYTEEMRVSWKQNLQGWKDVLAKTMVTLLCFCVDANQCHRTLLAHILVKLGAVYIGERQGSFVL